MPFAAFTVRGGPWVESRATPVAGAAGRRNASVGASGTLRRLGSLLKGHDSCPVLDPTGEATSDYMSLRSDPSEVRA